MKTAIKLVKSFIALIVIFYVVFGVANAPTILKLLRNRGTPPSGENQSRLTTIAQIKMRSDDTKSKPRQLGPVSASASTSAPSESSSQFQNDWFYYPQLGIEGQVEWNIDMQIINQVMIDSLTHLSGSAQPGEAGDMLISGHSSYYWWAKGKYKDIFAPLVRAGEGDSIVLKRNNVAYFYKVTQIYEIGANDDLKLNVGGDKPKSLFLLTCVPVGTNLRRLIVRSELEKIF